MQRWAVLARSWIFVENQEEATTAVASIEDAAGCGERADALVMGLLGRIMRQRRTVAAAMDYVGALSRETRANCWELALRAGHEGLYRLQALLSRYKWSWEQLRDLLPGLAQDVLPDDPDDLIVPGLAFDETADLTLWGTGREAGCAAVPTSGGVVLLHRRRGTGDREGQGARGRTRLPSGSVTWARQWHLTTTGDLLGRGYNAVVLPLRQDG